MMQSKSLLPWACLVAPFLALPAQQAPATAGGAATSAPAALAAKLDAHVASYYAAKQFRGTVLVAQQGRPILRKSYGLANEEWEIPNTPDTKYRLGSITKQFTAAAVLQLVEQGKVKLDDPIKTYYPGAPAAWDRITIHHLLNHTSGIPSYTGLPGFEKLTRTPMKPADVVRPTQDLPLEFDPGTKFAYNNTGYILLGMVIEKASGKSYAAYLRQNILQPLKMNDTGYDSSRAILRKRASGYGDDGRNAEFLDMSIPYAAGSLYSTVDDLLLWQQALYAGQVISKASLEKMLTPGLGDYGYGIVVQKLDGHMHHGHGGGINGFSTWLGRLADDGVTVIVLGNQESEAPDHLGTELPEIVLGKNVPPYRPAAKVNTERAAIPAEKLDRLAGTYQLTPTFSLKVWRDGEKMLTQATGQGVIEVVPTSETTLAQPQIQAELVFTLGADGKATQLLLKQNGREIPAKRIGD